MIRSCALAAIACIALFSSISIVTAEPLPTETFKILPAALAVEAAQAAIASCKTQGYSCFRRHCGPSGRSQATSRWRWCKCSDPQP